LSCIIVACVVEDGIEGIRGNKSTAPTIADKIVFLVIPGMIIIII
jgi:hypothetical protein